MSDLPRFGSADADADADAARDAGAIVRFARRVAAPRLHVRTFHVRARLLKDLAAHLVTSDRSFDIDRGIEALAAYAAKARRELPDGYIVLDGPRETVDCEDAGVERRIRTSLAGVALHINASRFPCGELLIKFAPAFLAGVPTIVKPASSTIPVVMRLFNRIAQSQIIPEGALAILTGDADDVLAHLGPQDVIVVSGGREATAKLRSNAALAPAGVRVLGDRNVTGVSILGADALDGSPEFDLFVRDLAADLLNVERCTLAPRIVCDAIAHALTHTMQTLGAHGPLPTVTPYDSIAEALAVAARHVSGAVATIYTYDAAIASALIGGLASFHDRVIVLDRECSSDATSDRAAQHADIRRVYDYMHVTTLRGSAERVAAYTSTWGRGAAELAETQHPFRFTFDDLAIGQTLHTAARTITLEDIEQFAEFTGDTFYAHMDEEAAKANPFFPGRVAHGYLLLAFAAGLFVDPDPGPVLANTGLDNLRFTKPVSPGDSISVRLTVASKTPRGPKYGEVRWDVELTNQHGESVAVYELLTMNATSA